MTPTTVALIEAATGRPVAATLHPSLTAAEVVAAEAAWGPLRRAAGGAEHSHWDWSLKTGYLAKPGVTCIGIEYAGEMQGMVMLDDVKATARLAPDRGRPVVYVEFVEAAPWNLRTAVPGPRYLHVGRWLIGSAVGRSRALGWGGRIGLHSLPQSEGFYGHGCRMTPLGPDSGYDGLMYFEFTAAQADGFPEGRT